MHDPDQMNPPEGNLPERGLSTSLWGSGREHKGNTLQPLGSSEDAPEGPLSRETMLLQVTTAE